MTVEPAQSERSVSNLVNPAVQASLADDADDLASFEARAGEPDLAFEEAPKDLKRRGKL